MNRFIDGYDSWRGFSSVRLADYNPQVVAIVVHNIKRLAVGFIKVPNIQDIWMPQVAHGNGFGYKELANGVHSQEINKGGIGVQKFQGSYFTDYWELY